MFAELSIEAIEAAIVLVLAALGKLIQEYFRNRREANASEQGNKLLRDIAISNQAIREGQLAQNGKLELLATINQTNHTAILKESQNTIAAMNNLSHALYTTLPEVKKSTETIFKKT